MPKITFGQKVQELRRQRGFTQRDLTQELQARGVKADFTYLSKIENNRLEAPPSEALIRALAEVLDTNAEELLELAGKFDQHALQEVVNEMPEAGVLLRMLQSREISREDIQKLIQRRERRK